MFSLPCEFVSMNPQRLRTELLVGFVYDALLIQRHQRKEIGCAGFAYKRVFLARPYAALLMLSDCFYLYGV